jgi:two-component system response regulator HydG
MERILIIDDDYDIRFLLDKLLTQHKYIVESVPTAKKALELIEKKSFDLVLCDYRLEGMEGNQLMIKIKEKQQIPIIIITGLNDIKTAVTTIKSGAFDYILKPLLPEQILHTVKEALKLNHSEKQSDPQVLSTPVSFQKEAERSFQFKKDQYIIGRSEAFNIIMHQISLVAPTDYSVIIYGESGTGKEAIAKEIHKRSNRSKQPFIAIDCGALSKDLAGSELFGHEKGSFTGAINSKVGSFELANKGTIFLDEVANLSYDVQVSLLRVIQERSMRRIGGNVNIELDVRVIIASNERLWESSKQGRFREDLYHRFNEFTIEVPPLRGRKDDIPIFANYFLKLSNNLLQKHLQGFTPEVMEAFLQYNWPGNLREFQNVVKRAALITEENTIDSSSIPAEIVNYSKSPGEKSKTPAPDVSTPLFLQNEQADEKITSAPKEPKSLRIASIDHEYALIMKTLRENDNNKSKTAKILNIDRKTLYNKISIYQELIEKKNGSDE